MSKERVFGGGISKPRILSQEESCLSMNELKKIYPNSIFFVDDPYTGPMSDEQKINLKEWYDRVVAGNFRFPENQSAIQSV
jgi:bacillopeptidase F (M6 metalloprotease family)